MGISKEIEDATKFIIDKERLKQRLTNHRVPSHIKYYEKHISYSQQNLLESNLPTSAKKSEQLFLLLVISVTVCVVIYLIAKVRCTKKCNCVGLKVILMKIYCNLAVNP